MDSHKAGSRTRTLATAARRRWLAVAVIGVFTSHAGAEEAVLAPWFTEEQLQAFGLAELAPEEQSALAAWLAERLGAAEQVDSADLQQGSVERAFAEKASNETSAEPEVSSVSASSTANESAETSFGLEQVPEPKEKAERELGQRIQARIKGPFRGWDGKTLFRLDNGQIWRQRIGGRYRYRADSPAVEIVKGRFGYTLEVVETGRQIGVRRVR